MQQKAGLKLAEEAIQYRPTSTGQYRQASSYKHVIIDGAIKTFCINIDSYCFTTDVGQKKKKSSAGFTIANEGVARGISFQKILATMYR